MKINARFAEPFWRSIGQRDLELDMDDGAQVADVLDKLRAVYPALSKELDTSPPLIFVEEHEAASETLLADGNRIYLMWPVAGG